MVFLKMFFSLFLMVPCIIEASEQASSSASLKRVQSSDEHLLLNAKKINLSMESEVGSSDANIFGDDSYDFSMIIRHFDAIDIIPDYFKKNDDYVEIFTRYYTPEGKELWFIPDSHGRVEVGQLVKLILNTTEFTHAIFENNMLLQAFKDCDPFVKSSDVLSDNDNYSFNYPLYFLQKEKKLQTKIISGDHETASELISACRKNKMTDSQILCYVLESIGDEYGIFKNGKKKSGISCNKKFNKTIKKILPTASLQGLLKKYVPEMTIDDDLYDYGSYLDDIVEKIRNQNLAQTIMNTLKKTETKSVFVLFGAAHYFALAPFLEHYLGKPQEIRYQDYYRSVSHVDTSYEETEGIRFIEYLKKLYTK